MTRVRRGFTSVLLGLDDEGEKGLHFVSVGNISKRNSVKLGKAIEKA